MKVFGYLRVSGRGQLDGDGFDRQGEKIVEFCRLNNIELFHVFEEGAISGTVEGLDRPQFSAMLERIDALGIEHCRIDGIVVERMDRLARDLMVSEVLLAECRKRGLKVFSADQGALIDMTAEGADPTRVLIRQIMGALAQWEKSMLVNKLKSARDRIKASGKRCEGTKPFGSVPKEVQCLRAIDAWYVASDPMGFSILAARLNDEGFTMRNGKPWNRDSVKRLIQRRKKKQ